MAQMRKRAAIAVAIIAFLISFGAGVSMAQQGGQPSQAKSSMTPEQEARMQALLDFVLANKISLDKTCVDPNSRIILGEGTFRAGALACHVANIKVYLGSFEIEYKLDHCQKSGKPEADHTFVFGSPRKGEFDFITEDETHYPLYLCAVQ